MTNSEATEQLKFLKKVDFHIDTKESHDIAISALEENAKLKAEIERIKNESHRRSDMFLQEIEQLKLYVSEIINARNLSEETVASIRAKMQRELMLAREIEQLRGSRNYILEVNESLVRINDKRDREITKLKDENEQLKSELEQSVKLQNVLSKLLKGSEFARCYMCDNSMKNITLDGKNNGCDGSCYHANKYTEKDLLDKIKRELDRMKGKV